MYDLIRKKPHYAWVVCLGCALVYFCTTGLSINDFSVYTPFIRDHRGFSNTQISLLNSVRSLFCMGSLFLIEGYYGKLKLRNGMLLAGIFSVAGYFVFGLAESYPAYLVGASLAGCGFGLGAMVPISIILGNWFYTDKILAISLVGTASGLSTIGIPSLITAVIQQRGLRVSFILQGCCMLAILFVAWLLIRETPEELSLEAYRKVKAKGNGKNTEKEAQQEAESSGRTIADGMDAQDPAVRKALPRFWWYVLYFMAALSTSFIVAGYSNLSLLATTEGYEPGIVAAAFSVCGIMLMVGKLMFGVLSEKITLYKTSMIFGTVCMISTAACCLIRLGTPVLFTAYGFFGASLALIAVGLVAWVDDWAVLEEHTMRVKNLQLFYSVGSLGTNLLPGIMADLSGGSYVPYYAYATVSVIVVVFIVWLTYRKSK